MTLVLQETGKMTCPFPIALDLTNLQILNFIFQGNLSHMPRCHGGIDVLYLLTLPVFFFLACLAFQSILFSASRAAEVGRCDHLGLA